MNKDLGKIADDQVDDLDNDFELEEEGEDNLEGEGAGAGSQDDDTGESPEIKKLRKQAEDADARAKEYEAENQRLKGEKTQAIDARFAAAESELLAHERENITKIESTNDAIKELQKQKKEALDAGENDKVVELDELIMDKKIDLRGLQHQKGQISEAKTKLTEIKENQSKNPEVESRQSNDGETLTKAAKEWVDKNPLFNTDPEFQAEAVGAHEIAVRKRIKVDSPEYFAFIEDRLKRAGYKVNGDDSGEGESDDDTIETQEPKKKPVKNPQSYGASGSSGSSPAGGSVRKQMGKLTAAEVEAAEMSNMTPREYWEYKYGSKAPKKE